MWWWFVICNHLTKTIRHVTIRNFYYQFYDIYLFYKTAENIEEVSVSEFRKEKESFLEIINNSELLKKAVFNENKKLKTKDEFWLDKNAKSFLIYLNFIYVSQVFLLIPAYYWKIF